MPDRYLIRSMSGVRVLTGQTDPLEQAEVGAIVTASQVDRILSNTGYQIKISVPDNYKAPAPKEA